jgi:AcrR family transcriptional regulator
MALSSEARANERERIARMVLDLIRERGVEISYSGALAESGLTRPRFEQLFEDYDDLFDTVAQLWLAPHLRAMEEALASDLPPNRKMYEFFRSRFAISRERWSEDPETFTIIWEMGAANVEKVRSYIDLADHYLCEIIVEAQADGYFAGLEIDETLSLINQIVSNYTQADALIYLGDRLTEQKLARIIDMIFVGLSGESGGAATGLNRISVAS